MTVYHVSHTTTYRYRRPVGFGEHRLLFRPRDSFDQRLVGSSLDVWPAPCSVDWSHDVFGNCVATLSFREKAEELRFLTRIEVEHTPLTTPDFRIDPQALAYPFAYQDEELPDLESTMRPQFADDGGEVRRWARQFASGSRRMETGKLLMTMCYAIHEGFIYRRRHERGTQPPLITLRSGRGTCRDFALLMMEAVRTLGFAARFVTGYIYVPSRDTQDTVGGGSTHAWCQVYLPGAGWVEFDPTNGIVGNRDLIRVAVVRDPMQAVPLSGSYYGDAGDDLGMTVEVAVSARD